jgi:hypothetical protein
MSILEILVTAQKYITYISYIIFVAGLIGNSLNILVFTKLKIFQHNRCAFYLIIESIVDNLMLLQIFIPETLQFFYQNDPGNFSLIWCKIRTTLGEPCRLLIGSIICYEAFDQYLSTHHQIYCRQLTTLPLARYLISITYGIWVLQTIPYLIYYQIIPGFGCIIINEGLIRYYSYVYYIFLDGLIPIVASSSFSLLAYRNVRRLILRRIPLERRRLDRQMTAMIFARVIVFVILMMPYTIFRIYILNNNTPPSNALQYTINQFVSLVVVNLLTWIYSVRF